MSTVFLDIDDVVADWMTAACDLHGKDNPYLNMDNHGRYDVAKLLGIKQSKFVAKMGFKFYFGLERTPEARLIYDFAKSLGQVYFLSATVVTKGCRDGKDAWVRKHFPGTSLIMADPAAKQAFAHVNAWLIDDRDSNVSQFRAAGGRGILVPRPWNSLHKHAISVSQTMKSIGLQRKMYDEGKL